jgi:hypothetical protein
MQGVNKSILRLASAIRQGVRGHFLIRNSQSALNLGPCSLSASAWREYAVVDRQSMTWSYIAIAKGGVAEPVGPGFEVGVRRQSWTVALVAGVRCWRLRNQRPKSKNAPGPPRVPSMSIGPGPVHCGLFCGGLFVDDVHSFGHEKPPASLAARASDGEPWTTIAGASANKKG